MPIDTRHKEYQAIQKRWIRMCDVCEGEDAIKQKETVYLPKPNPHDKSQENNLRYQEYLDRAVFVEVTKDTLDKYAGQAFSDDPILNVAEDLEYLKQNATGKGTTIYQIAQKCFIDLLRYGRAGVLVDYPDTSAFEDVSREVIEKHALRPNLVFYDAFSIINWRIKDNQLIMLVLAEEVESDGDDDFTTKSVKQYRYLGLDDIGFFIEIWQETKNGVEQIGDRRYPTLHGDKPLQNIPFVIMGSDSNDFEAQSIPLESLAKVNLAHYRNSADYEDSVFRCGQIQGVLSGVSLERLRYFEDKDIKLGSATALMLEPNSTFHYAQANPNSMVYEAMQDKYAFMKQLGAKLVETTNSNKTATQSAQEHSTQNSIASKCIANLNEAFNLALVYVYQYANLPYDESVLFKAKQEFTTPTADPAMMTALMGYVQSGLAPKSVVFNYLRKHNLINAELSDDDLIGMIDADGPEMIYETFDQSRAPKDETGE